MHAQGCFEREAEVIQASHKDSSLHFEEENTCVHPTKPSFDAEAALGFDSASEGDPEAFSLAGSVCPSCQAFRYLSLAAAAAAAGLACKCASHIFQAAAVLECLEWLTAMMCMPARQLISPWPVKA